jgi:hypothetical protein
MISQHRHENIYLLQLIRQTRAAEVVPHPQGMVSTPWAMDGRPRNRYTTNRHNRMRHTHTSQPHEPYPRGALTRHIHNTMEPTHANTHYQHNHSLRLHHTDTNTIGCDYVDNVQPSKKQQCTSRDQPISRRHTTEDTDDTLPAQAKPRRPGIPPPPPLILTTLQTPHFRNPPAEERTIVNRGNVR